MGQGHCFNTVGDQFPGRQGIVHPDVAHGNSVTDADRRKLDRRPPGHRHTGLDRRRNLVQVHMSRDNLTFGVDNPDQRPVDLLLRQTQSFKKRAVRGPLQTCFNQSLPHRITPLLILHGSFCNIFANKFPIFSVPTRVCTGTHNVTGPVPFQHPFDRLSMALSLLREGQRSTEASSPPKNRSNRVGPVLSGQIGG